MLLLLLLLFNRDNNNKSEVPITFSLTFWNQDKVGFFCFVAKAQQMIVTYSMALTELDSIAIFAKR